MYKRSSAPKNAPYKASEKRNPPGGPQHQPLAINLVDYPQPQRYVATYISHTATLKYRTYTSGHFCVEWPWTAHRVPGMLVLVLCTA